jgi:hypothetical protein
MAATPGHTGSIPVASPRRPSRLSPLRRRGAQAAALAGRHPAASLALFGAICAVVAWLRIPAVARDTLWAEDGRNFLQPAADHGLADTVLTPYAGYLHVVPRIIAGVVVALPVGWWALAMTAASCLVAGGLAVVVFVCARDVVPWAPARILVASLTVLAPLAPREVLGNTANLHSLLLWALLWLLLYRPRTDLGAAALGAVGLFAGLTEIQGLLLVPLLLCAPHGRRRWAVRGGILLGLAAQLVVTVLWPRAHSTHPPVPPLSIAYGYLINVVMPIGVPQAAIGPVLSWAGPAVAIAILFCLTPAVVFALIRGSRLQRWVVAALVVASVVFFTVDITTNPDSFYDYASFTPSQLLGAWLTRYGVVPSMMLIALVPIAASIAVERRRPALTTNPTDLGHPGARVRSGHHAVARMTAVASCAVIAVLLLAQVGPQMTRRSRGPEWQPQIAAAAEGCESAAPSSRVVLRETIGWHVVLSCRWIPQVPSPD